MSTVQGGQGNIVTNGLVLNLDVANPRSYPQPYNGTIWSNLVAVSSSLSGSLVNGVGYTGSNGGALVFDGVDDYVDTTYTSPIGINPATFSAWIRYTSSQIGVFIAKRLDAPTYQQFSIYIAGDVNGNTSGTKIAISDVQTTSLLRAGITSDSYGDGRWHHVVGTRTSTTTQLYVDGILLFNSSSAAIDLTASSKLFIGRSGNNQTVGGAPFNGSIALTQVYNRALNASEVLQNFNATRARFGV